jgi:hypothetical protein
MKVPKMAMHRRLRRDQIVEVRSKDEILATLDDKGALDGLRFMPEMLAFCGSRYRVFRRADLICVEGLASRRHMKNAVLLDEVRCNGSRHGGCQRDCLIFWKESWLRRVTTAEPGADGAERLECADALCPRSAPAMSSDDPPAAGSVYSCQSSALHEATVPSSGWRSVQHLSDLSAGDLRLPAFAALALGAVYRRIRRLVRGTPPVWAAGASATPRASLNLQPGDLVEIRSREEILGTLDTQHKNRGLTFEYEMLDSCGRRFKVARRVDRILIETTGMMRTIRDTVVLEGLRCHACPRANPFYWREIWLRRAE